MNIAVSDRLKSRLVLGEREKEEDSEEGDKLKKEIDQENMEILSKLSEQEILEKKQQLEQAISEWCGEYFSVREGKVLRFSTAYLMKLPQVGQFM